MRKPLECAGCSFAKLSTGFVGDFCPTHPKLAVVVKMPGTDEIVSGAPMTGGMGKYAFKEFIRPAGFEREDVLISNVLRCLPNAGEFPVGAERKGAVAFCRRWDDGLLKFDPDVIGVSFNPAALMRQPQTTVFLRRAFERARRMVEEGHRPCLLLGEEARETFAPWLQGQTKKWQGHWWRKKS